MRIKSIKLKKSYGGYKSVDLDPHFSVITDGNIAEDTNFFDAIWFVMGLSDMSQFCDANNINVEIMSKMIASVTITLDNKTGVRPSGYEHCAEIVISREIRQSTTGLINGKRVTMSKIREYFCRNGLNIIDPQFIITRGMICSVVRMDQVKIFNIMETAETKRFLSEIKTNVRKMQECNAKVNNMFLMLGKMEGRDKIMRREVHIQRKCDVAKKKLRSLNKVFTAWIFHSTTNEVNVLRRKHKSMTAKLHMLHQEKMEVHQMMTVLEENLKEVQRQKEQKMGGKGDCIMAMECLEEGIVGVNEEGIVGVNEEGIVGVNEEGIVGVNEEGIVGVNEEIAGFREAVKVDIASDKLLKASDALAEEKECVKTAKRDPVKVMLEEKIALKIRIDGLSLKIEEVRNEISEMEKKIGVKERKLDDLMMQHDWIVKDRMCFGQSKSIYDFKMNNPDIVEAKIHRLKKEHERLERFLKAVSAGRTYTNIDWDLWDKQRDLKSLKMDQNKLAKSITILKKKRMAKLKVQFKNIHTKFQHILPNVLEGSVGKLECVVPGDITRGLKIKVRLEDNREYCFAELGMGQRYLIALSFVLATVNTQAPSPIFIIDDINLDFEVTQKMGYFLKSYFRDTQLILGSMKKAIIVPANKTSEV